MVLVPDVSSSGEKLDNYYQKRSPRVFVSQICWKNFEAWISKVLRFVTKQMSINYNDDVNDLRKSQEISIKLRLIDN